MPFFKNPETGNVGEISRDMEQDAISDGLVPMTRMKNPETNGVGWVESSKAREALDDGLEIVSAIDEQPPEISQHESGLRGFAQGATFGFADEIGAGSEALKRKVSGESKVPMADEYQRLLDQYRQLDVASQEQNPWTHGGTELAASLAPAFGTLPASMGTKIANVANNLIPRTPKTVEQMSQLTNLFKGTNIPVDYDAITRFPAVARTFDRNLGAIKGVEAAGFGGAYSGLHKAGEQEEFDLGEIASSAGGGALLGGMLGTATPTISKMSEKGGEFAGRVGQQLSKIPEYIGKRIGVNDPMVSKTLGIGSDILMTGGYGTAARALGGAGGKIGEKIAQSVPKANEKIAQSLASGTSPEYMEAIAPTAAKSFTSLINYLSPDKKQAEDDFSNGQNNTYSEEQ